MKIEINIGNEQIVEYRETVDLYTKQSRSNNHGRIRPFMNSVILKLRTRDLLFEKLSRISYVIDIIVAIQMSSSC